MQRPWPSRKAAVAPKAVSRNTVAAAVSGEVPASKRNVMNLLLVGAIGLCHLPVGGFAYFFVPPGESARRVRRATRPSAQGPSAVVFPLRVDI